MIIGNSRKRNFPGKLPWVLLGLAVIAALILPFIPWPEDEDLPGFIHCGMEEVYETAEGKKFKGENGVFGHGETQAEAHARSGKYSSRAMKGSEFAAGLESTPVTPGATYEVSVWRYSDFKKGYLVVSGSWGDSYANVEIPEKTGSDGWELLKLTVNVPMGEPNPELQAYVWNPTENPAWFDDFTVRRVEQSIRYALPTFELDSIEQLNLIISSESMDKLDKKRLEALTKGLLMQGDDDWVKVRMECDAGDLKGKLRLKGDWTDHLRGQKWSFRVRLKAKNAWRRMLTFSLQNPATRSYLDEWVYHQFLQSEDILTTRYDFVSLSLNGEPLGLYAYEEHFEKQLLEYNKRREGPILKFVEDGFWEIMEDETESVTHMEPLVPIVESAEIDAFKMNRVVKDSVLYGQFKAGSSLMEQYKFAKGDLASIFDLDKMAKYFAIVDVFRAHHGLVWHNQRMYYNPVTGKIEPIGFDAYSPDGPVNWLQRPFTGHGQNPRYFSPRYWSLMIDQFFGDKEFVEKYCRYLYHYSNYDFIKRFLSGLDADIRYREALIKEEVPDYQFKWDFVGYSARRIRSVMLPRPNTSVRAHLDKQENGKYTYRLFNYHCLPVIPVGVGDESGKIKGEFKDAEWLPAFTEHSVPEYAYLTTDKVGDYLLFRIPGLDSIFSAPLRRWEPPGGIAPSQELFPQQQPESNSLYTVAGNQIVFKTGEISSEKDILIPSGYTVRFRAGTTLDLRKGAKFISWSRLEMRGSDEAPILVTSSDKSAAGFTILQADSVSYLDYVVFDNLNTLSYKGWNLTGAVTFYESEVEMGYCRFVNNHCEDAINIVRGRFLMSHCYVGNTAFDGFDCDFCNGLVEHSTFYRTGNDGLDFSGSNIYLKNVTVEETGDKGISVGEESQVTIEFAKVKKLGLGLAAKDLSKVTIKMIEMEDLSQGFAAYQKKTEYGGGEIVVLGYKAKNVEELYAIQTGSKITIDDKEIQGTR